MLLTNYCGVVISNNRIQSIRFVIKSFDILLELFDLILIQQSAFRWTAPFLVCSLLKLFETVQAIYAQI